MRLKEFLETYKEDLKGFEMTSVSSKNEIILTNDPYIASIEMKIFCQKIMPLHNILKINPTVREISFQKIIDSEYAEKVNYGVFGMKTVYSATGETIKISLNENQDSSKYITESVSEYGKIITYTNNIYYGEGTGFFLYNKLKPRDSAPYNNTEGPALIVYDAEGKLINKFYYFDGKLCEDPLKIAVFNATKKGGN